MCYCQASHLVQWRDGEMIIVMLDSSLRLGHMGRVSKIRPQLCLLVCLSNHGTALNHDISDKDLLQC